jgi:hypothetical protein
MYDGNVFSSTISISGMHLDVDIDVNRQGNRHTNVQNHNASADILGFQNARHLRVVVAEAIVTQGTAPAF